MTGPRALLILMFAVAAPAFANAQESGFLGSMGEPIDTTAPIEISADALEVLQAEQVAIFSGNVDALQGDLRLQAAELRVHYSSGEGTGGEISRINASGEVHVSLAGETARGDSAIYDVLEERVTMEGNVVLVQGGNTIQGDRLTIDLTNGRSRIEGGASVVSEDNDEGRVRGVFTIPRGGDADAGSPEDSGAPEPEEEAMEAPPPDEGDVEPEDDNAE